MALAGPGGASQAGPALRKPGPIELLDRALLALRRSPGLRLARAWLAGLPLSAVCLALYHFEVIEGVASLRALFAALLVLGFVLRALALSRVAQELVLELRPGLPLPERAPAPAHIVSTAAVAALGVLFWLWPLAWLAQLSPFAIALLIPLLALRGGVATSWLARARCAPEGGLRAFSLASDDAAGARAALMFVELLVLLGIAGLFVNLYALTALSVLLSHAVLGLDVALVSAFLSPDNEFVAYAVLALALLVVEPLRAAVSACVFADARSRKDGADLHAAIDALLAQAPGSGAAPRLASTVAASPSRGTRGGVLALLLIAAWPARAEPPARAAEPTPLETRGTQDDVEVRHAVEDILARREFGDFGQRRARSLETWLGELLERLFEPAREESEPARPLRVDLPEVSPFIVMASVFLLLGAALGSVVWDMRRRDKKGAVAQRSDQPGLAGLPAPQRLADARQLADAGDFAAALRALYVASLGTLDRAGLIQLDPAKTNGQYLRAMPVGAERELFSQFTRVFDRKHYGREATSRADYEAGLSIAEQLCGPDGKRS